MELGAGLLIGAGLDGGPGWQGSDTCGRVGRTRLEARARAYTCVSCPARGEIGWVGSRGMTVGAREHSVKLKGS